MKALTGPRCQGIKKGGEPCGAGATAESGYTRCPFHSEGISAEQKLEWQKRGGNASRPSALPEDLVLPPAENPKALKAFLRKLIPCILDGSISTTRGNAAGFLIRIISELSQTQRKGQGPSELHYHLHLDGLAASAQLASGRTVREIATGAGEQPLDGDPGDPPRLRRPAATREAGHPPPTPAGGLTLVAYSTHMVHPPNPHKKGK